MNLKNFEEISIKIIPALEQIIIDGWVLRFFKNYLQRANLIQPLYNGKMNIYEKIQQCKEIYSNKGLSHVFRLTSFTRPQALDQILYKQKYIKSKVNRMLYINSKNYHLEKHDRCIICKDMKEWISACQIISDCTDLEASIHYKFRKLINLPKCLMIFEHSGKPVSCGMGLLDKSYVGIFDVKTKEEYRNQGCAAKLINSILGYAKQKGAVHAYLNLTSTNIPAFHLYSKIGFREIYEYWYRSKV